MRNGGHLGNTATLKDISSENQDPLLAKLLPKRSRRDAKPYFLMTCTNDQRLNVFR